MFRTAQSLFALARLSTVRSIRAYNIQPGPIGLLPVELLLEVFKLMDRNGLALCMQVCKRWYDITSPDFFADIPVRYSHRQRFARHIRAHPEHAGYIKDVYFFGRHWGDPGYTQYGDIDWRPFDIQVLASTLPVLRNLRRLFIVGYDNKIDLPLPLQRITRRRSTPVALQKLILESCFNVPFILHGLLPLFSIDTLITDAFRWALFGQRPPVDIGGLFPPASLTIRNLVFRGPEEGFYGLFERALAPGVLRALGTGSWWGWNLYVLNQFLRSDGARNLLSISIGGLQPAEGTPSACEVLGAALALCPQLQYVRIGLTHRGHPDENAFSRPDALDPLFASLPTTLRAFAFHVWILNFWRQPWGWSVSVMRHLDAVDRFLDPAGEGRGFPHLQRVELHVHYGYEKGMLCDTRAREMRERPRPLLEDLDQGVPLLPRLQAAGLLREIRVDEEGLGPDRSADVYWPADMM